MGILEGHGEADGGASRISCGRRVGVGAVVS